MGGLESRIDDLYRLPLNEFVSARAALAKSLAGADAQRVRRLAKPTVVAWAVNQVYWRARSSYERVVKSGHRLREAQVAALEGKKPDQNASRSDLQSAADAHLRAMAAAVREAERFAAAEGSDPGADALMRTFEAMSLALDLPETPGRLTRALQPAGFEALAGIKVKAEPRAHAVNARFGSTQGPSRQIPAMERASKKEAAARKKREAALKRAEAAVERAKRRMLEAQEALRRTRDQTS